MYEVTSLVHLYPMMGASHLSMCYFFEKCLVRPPCLILTGLCAFLVIELDDTSHLPDL